MLWFARDLELQLHYSSGIFIFFKKSVIYAVCQIHLLGPRDTYTYTYTSEQIYCKCSFYYGTLIIQIDHVVAEILSDDYQSETENRGLFSTD